MGGAAAGTSAREIRWDDVVKIEALGTDAVGPFEVWLTFTHADGSTAVVFPHTPGYGDVLRIMLRRFPEIPPGWVDEMAEQPWHVERVLIPTRRETGHVEAPTVSRETGLARTEQQDP